jgi:hypothetical protein
MKTSQTGFNRSSPSAMEELLLTQRMMRIYYWKVLFNPAERRDTRELLVTLKYKVKKTAAR